MSEFFFFLSGIFVGFLVLIVWSALSASSAFEDEHGTEDY